MSDEQTSATSAPVDKFLFNGYGSKQEMLDAMARDEVRRHECEVRYLLRMSFKDRMDALYERKRHRGESAVLKLKQDMLAIDPSCLRAPEKKRTSLEELADRSPQQPGMF